MQEPDLLAVETELERIISSKLFKNSTVLCNFLRYVVMETLGNRIHEIKEYTIAVKALGKPPDFNPQTDAVIRIHAGRLRRSLLEYYKEEGNNDPVMISLQKGSYIPAFIAVDGTNGHPNSTPIQAGHGDAPVNQVAVLPFKNLSGSPENDFIVDGFCEQLSADLAQFPEITVISYFSTAKFKDAKPDIRMVGKELSASHLITGSIYRDKKHLRISIQLVKAATGAQLWTQNYERPLNSGYLYGIFDDLIKQIVPRLTGYYGLINRNASVTQLDPLLDSGVIDAVFWYYHYQVTHTEDVYQAARSRIEKSLQQNPNYALAWALLAQLYVDGMAYFYKNINDPLAEANKCVQKALQLDPDCQHAYLSLTWMFIFLRNKDSAIESLDYCISINPTSPFFLGASSFLYGLLGEYDKSMNYFEQSNILNPYYPWWVNLGPYFTHFSNDNFAGAFEYANRIHIPGVFWNDIFRISTLTHLQKIKEATELAEKHKIEFPGMAEGAHLILKAVIFEDRLYKLMKEGLEKAGLPV